MQEIRRLEEELRLAMLSSNVEKLDKLVDDELVFVGLDGSVVDKQMDLEAHKSGLQKMTQLEQRQQVIKIVDDMAIVTVLAEIKGLFADFDISGKYRYLRVWKKQGNSYKVVSGSVVKIP